jgi:uncharacterized protein YhfF
VPGVWGRVDGRRIAEFGTPGEMRDRLVALIRAGRKTATAGLYVQDYEDEGEPLEHVGEELAVLDSAGTAVAVIAVDAVQVVTFGEVTWEFADAEGEGFTSVSHWRDGHRRFWAAQGVAVTDETPVVCLWFHLLQGASRRH